MKVNRRDLLAGIGGLSAGLILSGCSSADRLFPIETQSSSLQGDEVKNGEVTAVEDLMREHGVLRRALFVYSEAVHRLCNKPSNIIIDSLHKTARLFRLFGEDYHEKKLEEMYIFPVVKKTGGPASVYPDILIAQHNRGREITDYILAATEVAKSYDVLQLASIMKSFVRMYRPHAAREDTVVFPAWKQALSAKQLDDMSDMFEDIEHQQFGEDGFETAVKQITAIEDALALADLSQFTVESIAR